MREGDDALKATVVSLVVPVYNTANYLETCLNSLLRQSHQLLQIILVNDGSTDESETICLKYCAIDPRLVYHKKENGGLSSARNAGLELATGEYIGFIDSDDYVSPNFVEGLLGACLKYQCGVSACGRLVVYDHRTERMFHFDKEQLWDGSHLIQRFLQWNGLDGSVCDKLFHRSFLPLLHFTPGRISEDLPITCAVLLKSKRIVHVGEAMYHYIQRGSSITNHGFSATKISVLDSTSEVCKMVISTYPQLKSRAKAYHWQHMLLLQDMLIGRESQFPQANQRLRSEIVAELFAFLGSPFFSWKAKVKTMVLLCVPILHRLK